VEEVALVDAERPGDVWPRARCGSQEFRTGASKGAVGKLALQHSVLEGGRELDGVSMEDGGLFFRSLNAAECVHVGHIHSFAVENLQLGAEFSEAESETNETGVACGWGRRERLSVGNGKLRRGVSQLGWVAE
jgi:hypothetical protein